MMGVYLSHLRNQKDDAAHRPRARRELRARGDAAVLDRPRRAERRRHACAPAAARRSRPTRRPTSPAWPRSSPAGAGTARPGRTTAASSAASSAASATPTARFKPMLGYPQYHSTEGRASSARTIAAQGTADPAASLTRRARHAGRHPNVGPFIGRQLIQRLVTSNPSPAYVARVAARLRRQRQRRARRHEGRGARDPARPRGARAAGRHAPARCASRCCACRPSCAPSAARSDSGDFRRRQHRRPGHAARPDAAALALGVQLLPPGLRAAGHARRPRPAWWRPSCRSPTRRRVAGYVNFMRDNVSAGVGTRRRDVQPPRPAAQLRGRAGAGRRAAALVERVEPQLIYGPMPAALRDRDRRRGRRRSRSRAEPRGTNQAADRHAPSATASTRRSSWRWRRPSSWSRSEARTDQPC